MRIAAMALSMGLALVLGPARPAKAAAAPKPPSGSIAGAVLDQDSAPVAGIKVDLHKPRRAGAPRPGGAGPSAWPGVEDLADNPRTRTPPPVASATTDKDGKFTMKEVPPGAYRLVAGDMLRGVGFAEVTVEANKTVTKNLTVRKPAAPR